MSLLAPLPKELRPKDPAVLLATAMHLGRLRPAPGTWASLVAVLAGWGILSAAGYVALALLTVATVQAGIWAADRVIAAAGVEDPPYVVLDEFAGQWLVLLVTPLEPAALLAAFLLFRAFDIAKPWPVSWADRRLKGGIGAMADDLLAGLYAAIWIVTLTLLGAW